MAPRKIRRSRLEQSFAHVGLLAGLAVLSAIILGALVLWTR